MLQRVAVHSNDATVPAAVVLPSSNGPLLLACVILALPNFLFLGTHLRSTISAACSALCLAVAFAWLAQDLWRKAGHLDRSAFATCFCLGVVLCLLGGETHLFFANADWLIRDAVLGDLAQHPWPVGYLFEGQANLLRAPLGMYLGPALVGRVLGVGAAHAALLAQNSILLACVLYAFAACAASRRQAMTVIGIFLLFSGWDVVGQALVGKSLAFTTHLSQWAGDLQYSATMVQIFWVPNHALPGWLFVGGYLAWRRDQLSIAGLCVLFALCIFWSPLSAIGAMPFLASAGWSELRAARLERVDLAVILLAVLGIVPILLYLGADFGRVPHGSMQSSASGLGCYLVFEVIEVLPFAALLYFGSVAPMSRREQFETAIIFAILLCAPFYRIGSDDFMMRASIPALGLLALKVAKIIDPGFGSVAKGPALAGLAVLALGSLTPIYEIGRAITAAPYRISACNLMSANRFPPFDAPLYHYLARSGPMVGVHSILAHPAEYLAANPSLSTCWPDSPRFRG